MSAGIAFTLTDVAVRRSGRCILDIPHLAVEPGQFINLIGPNGAGKTTLLNVCCGLLRPDRGSVVFDGVCVNTLSGWGRTRLRKRIGYVPQRAEYNAELPFTVREVAVMGRAARKPLGVPLNRDDYAVAEGWLDRLGVGDRIHQTFSSLSGGQQQKALIARAMAQEPHLLILDEPVASCDMGWTFQIIEIVTNLARQGGLTVILVSHEIQSLPLTSDRTILLDGGRIVADGPTRQVLTSPELTSVYGCGVSIVQTDAAECVYCYPAA